MLDRILAGRLARSKSHAMLLGPRQTGKSTLASSLSPALSINLADEQTYLDHARAPRLLVDEVQALQGPALVLIDEVQRVPSILNTLQFLIDERIGGHRYLLTGSSARKLRRGGANLLPGRVLQERLCPLLFPELGSRFDLDRALTVGLLPGIYLSTEGADLLEGYANTYLREEIQAEGLAENIGAFARLLDIIAVSSGKWLNYSKLASDTEIPKETIRRYVSILEDTLVLERLTPFRGKTTPDRRARQKEKILLFDVGVRNALLRLHRTSLPQSLQGDVFEQFFILQVLGLIRALHLPWEAMSFLGVGDREVDLVLDTPGSLIGIEIKRGRQLHQKAFPGFELLESISRPYKKLRKYIIYTGERRLRLDPDIMVVPFQDVLADLSALQEQ